MKKTYIPPTTTVVRLLHHQSLLLITSTGNDRNIRYGGEYDGTEEPR
jgi:hypothetical protein